MKIGNRKLKWQAYVLFAGVILLITIPIIISINKKHNSIEYILGEKGYIQAEIEKIKSLNEDTKNYILENEYNKYYLELINYKYFINENFLNYINYHNKISEYDIEHIVAYVNTEAYKEEYEEVKQADLTDPYLVLVNKYNYLNSNYKPANLKNVSNWYAYEGRKLEQTTYEAFVKMFNNAKEDNMNLVLYRGYRSYADQKDIFDTYKADYGERQADSMVTRAGYSEYQTGLAIYVLNFYGGGEFEDSKEYTWVLENAHKYGFILRYPKGKEYITKFEFEPFHFRYVGVEAATVMHNENLTLEEYHAFYLK